jgi:hypothetical protein
MDILFNNPNVVNSQGQNTHLYKLDIHPTHGHQYKTYPKISKLVQNFPILQQGHNFLFN